MSPSELRELFERYIETVNRHETDLLQGFLHEKVMQNRKPVRRDHIISELRGHIDAVPDFMCRVENLAIIDDTAVARFYYVGTPAKKWLGLEPIGAKIEVLEFAYFKGRDGLFSEMDYGIDVMGAQRRLANFQTDTDSDKIE